MATQYNLYICLIEKTRNFDSLACFGLVARDEPRIAAERPEPCLAQLEPRDRLDDLVLALEPALYLMSMPCPLLLELELDLVRQRLHCTPYINNFLFLAYF